MSEQAGPHTITLLHHAVPSTEFADLQHRNGGEPLAIGVVHSVVDHDGTAYDSAKYAPAEGAEAAATEISFASEKARKGFVDYYRKHFVDPCVKGSFCHGLAAQVAGWESWATAAAGSRSVHPEKLQSGQVYSVVPADAAKNRGLDQSRHSMLGTTDPTKNASVLGMDLPLAVMDNHDSVRLFAGDAGEIRHTYDRLDPKDSRRKAVDDITARLQKIVRR